MNEVIKHLVSFSGGLCSWAAAKRVVERHGTEGVVLLFADTKIEDEDLYRFLVEAAANVGVPLTTIAEGRTPWEVMRDEKIIGGGFTGADPCSKKLKRQLLDKWFKENCTPESPTYVGLTWDESHRFERLRKRCPERQWEAPMCEAPYLDKRQIRELLAVEGIRLPRLYELGFPHNNCGGFCVKAGQAQFALLLKTMPARYAFHEQKEAEMRVLLGKEYSILTEQVKGKRRFLSLTELRERVERQLPLDHFDWGGCGCAID